MNTYKDFVVDLRRFSDQLQNDENPLLRAANFLIDSLPPEPPEKEEGYTAWDSPKQIRWYYWAVSSGFLENPYQRTHRVNNSFITSSVTETDTGKEVTVFSDYPNAVFVIGDAGVLGEQAAIHEGRWWEFDKEVERLSEDVMDEFEGRVFEDLDQFWAK